MAVVEDGIFINEEWNTRQLGEAYSELAYSGIQILDSLIPEVEALDWDMGSLLATVAVRKVLVPDNVSEIVRNRWDRNENWVFRFLASLPYHNTPGRIDRRVTSLMQPVEYFASIQDALLFLKYSRSRLGYLLADKSKQVFGTYLLTASSYLESRTLRLALYEGDYYARVETPTSLEN